MSMISAIVIDGRGLMKGLSLMAISKSVLLSLGCHAGLFE
jgi:hypothetical protein